MLIQRYVRSLPHSDRCLTDGLNSDTCTDLHLKKHESSARVSS